MVRECRLFGSWSLVCSSVYSCIAHPLLVCRSSASSCIARASARPSARPPARASLACRSFAAALLESWALVRLIIRYSSVCSCIVHLLLTCPLVHICSCIGCASLVCLFLCRSSVCSSLTCRCSAAGLSLGCSTRLFHCLTRLLHCSTAPLDSPCIPILLVEFGRHAVHTHSVPRVVSRHSVITHSLFHSCSHRRCCLVWSSA